MHNGAYWILSSPSHLGGKTVSGRPWKDSRAVLNGIYWVLRTGAPWADLPDRYPPYQTCHRRFQLWVRSGILKGVFEALAVDLKIRGLFNVRVESASPHEVKLVNSTLVEVVVPEAPENLVGDNAYDSDKLDAELRPFGIELVARQRSNRKNKSQDGRCLRRCRTMEN